MNQHQNYLFVTINLFVRMLPYKMYTYTLGKVLVIIKSHLHIFRAEPGFVKVKSLSDILKMTSH